MTLKNIVDVQITKETAQLTRVGFGTPLVLVTHDVTSKIAEIYADMDEVEDDGFTSADLAWQAANAVFAQNPKVDQIVLGKRTRQPTRKVTITPKSPPKASTLYRVTINGEDFDFTTDATPTEAEITAALTTAIDGGTVNVNATDNTTDLDVEAADSPGGVTPTPAVPFTVEYDKSLIEVHDDTPDPGLAADLSDVRDVNDNWYGVTGDWFGEAEATVMATAIEALQRIHGWNSQDTDVLDNAVTDDAFSNLNASAFERSFGFWHTKPHEFPAAAWIGEIFPFDPGESTWKFKTLAGVPFDTFTGAETTALVAKKANHLIRVAGNNITTEGVMHQGEFIDTVRGIDFVAQRIAEDVFLTLFTPRKVPYTDQGASMIQGTVDAVLQSATREGGGSGQIFTPDPAPVVTVPLVADIAAATRASRTLPDVRFTATLAGAVHKVEVRGTVTV